MAFDPENPRKWFTAGEAAQIAKACQVPGVPWTREGMTKLLKRVARDFADEHKALSRPRQGQKGGGGSEFYWALFPDALLEGLDHEVARRESARAAIDSPKPWSGIMSPEDEQLMRDAAGDDFGHITFFERPLVRRVRRSRVVVRGRSYFGGFLVAYEGQDVMVVLPILADPLIAFVWHCVAAKSHLPPSGADGYVGLVEADRKETNLAPLAPRLEQFPDSDDCD